MNKIKAVLFDLDGTLVDTLADLAASANFALKSCGYPEHPVEKYKYFVGNGITVMLSRASGKTEAEVTDRLLPVFMNRYHKHFCDKSSVYPGMPETITEIRIRGIKTAVITNKADEMARIILDKLYPESFDAIFGQRDGFPCKPDPSLTLLAMKELGVKPEDCIFTGDSGVDMQTAANSGAYGAGVLWGFRTAEELTENGAKILISSPRELLKLTK